jgi:hypothetical protein
MAQFAIRCHPSVPVAADELGRWRQRQVNDFRLDAPHGTIRLSRLTQRLLSRELSVGWLLELDVPEGEPLLAGDRLVHAVRDMQLLALQPTLLTPTLPGEPGLAKSAVRSPSSLSMWTKDAGL